jgi:hypothetical protein
MNASDRTFDILVAVIIEIFRACLYSNLIRPLYLDPRHFPWFDVAIIAILVLINGVLHVGAHVVSIQSIRWNADQDGGGAALRRPAIRRSSCVHTITVVSP